MIKKNISKKKDSIIENGLKILLWGYGISNDDLNKTDKEELYKQEIIFENLKNFVFNYLNKYIENCKNLLSV